MRKTVKNNKKTVSRKKKTAKPVNSRKKRSKKKSYDTIRAFMLVGILVIISVFISVLVIIIHSRISKPSPENNIVIEPAIELPVTESPSEITKVFVQPQNVIENPPPSPPPTTTTEKTQQPVNTQQTPNRNPQPAVNNSPPVTTPQRIPEQPDRNLGSLVFVIDDAGNNLWELDPFLKIPFPLTIAVLPGLPHSVESARRIRAAGKEVFLHQPMEALGGQNPGPGAIYSGMGKDEIRSILKRNIEEIGPVAGINNHQGSKVTMDREAVEVILAFCEENNLYFLDSRTTADSAVPAVARALGINTGQRDVFIDNEQDRNSMLNYINTGLGRAQRNGSVVMIGHTWSRELASLLSEQFPVFTNQGYTIRKASELIKN